MPFRITPKDSGETEVAVAPAADAKSAPAATAVKDRQSTGEILRGDKAQASSPIRNRGSEPDGSKAKAAEESEGAEEESVSTTTEQDAGERSDKEEAPSKSVRRRLRRHKQAEKAAGTAEAELSDLKAQVRLLTEALTGKGAPAASNGSEKPRGIEIPKFNEAFPKDGTDEQQEAWRLRKQIHEYSIPLAQQVAEGIVTTNIQNLVELLSPALQDYVDRTRNSQYERARPIVEEAGFDFDEVVSEAQSMVQKSKGQLPMEAAIGMVILSGQFDTEVDGKNGEASHNRKIPSRTAPAQGLAQKAAKVRESEGRGVFGNAWRDRSNTLVQILKDRAAARGAAKKA